MPGRRTPHRVTLIYTGSRGYEAGGKRYQVPLTVTDPLSPYGDSG